MADPLAGLNLESAIVLCESERYGDWFRDPWGWPELSFARATEARDALASAAANAGTYAAADLDVPKANFGIRPAVVLPPSLRVVYQAACLLIASKADLPAPFVYGWRSRGQPGAVANNRDEWPVYLAAVASGMQATASCLQTDITSFFASIPGDRIVERCLQVASKGNAMNVISKLIGHLDAGARTSGLPQRSTASALLANLYLEPLDSLILQSGSAGAFSSVARWMDDIWIFGSESQVRSAQVRLQTWLRDLGLEMNMGKTKFLIGDDLDEAIEDERLNEVPLSDDPFLTAAVSGGAERSSVLSEDRARELEDRMLNLPYYAPRPLTKHVLKSLRQIGSFERLDGWLEQAWRMPHVADSVARYVVDSEWPEYADWLADYLASDKALLSWASAQLATACSVDQPNAPLTDHFRSWLIGNDRMQVGVALSRMTSWQPQETRAVLREIAPATGDPAIQRLMLLAMLELREERAFVRKCAGAHPENALTAAMIEEGSYKPFRLVADFAGA